MTFRMNSYLSKYRRSASTFGTSNGMREAYFRERRARPRLLRFRTSVAPVLSLAARTRPQPAVLFFPVGHPCERGAHVKERRSQHREGCGEADRHVDGGQ